MHVVYTDNVSLRQNWTAGLSDWLVQRIAEYPEITCTAVIPLAHVNDTTFDIRVPLPPHNLVVAFVAGVTQFIRDSDGVVADLIGNPQTMVHVPFDNAQKDNPGYLVEIEHQIADARHAQEQKREEVDRLPADTNDDDEEGDDGGREWGRWDD